MYNDVVWERKTGKEAGEGINVKFLEGVSAERRRPRPRKLLINALRKGKEKQDPS